MSRRLTWMLVLFVVVLLAPRAAHAQNGSIAGTVRDPDGNVVPGVTVEVSSPALIERVRSTATDATGRYQIAALPVGTYSATFTLQGFNVVKRDGIELTSDFTAPVNVQLAVGSVRETVQVVGAAPRVDVQNARVQAVFQGVDIGNLPTQRDLASLVNLVPALTTSAIGICDGGLGIFCNPNGPAFNSHTSALDADGQNQGRIMVDGMSINRGGTGQGINLNTGMTNGISIDTANAQEVAFTLSGGLGETETGGAAINIVPRTGGNKFAGNYLTNYTGRQFFDRNRDTRLSDTPGTQPYTHDYKVDASFGGPIKRDFFWFYLQADKQGNEQYPNGGTVAGFANLNEGKFGANYVPDRTRGWLTFANEYKFANARLTLQTSRRNKFNLYWDEQDACTNPCHGMINIVDSPEAYFTLQNRPNRLMQISWTNPLTNKLLFEAGLSVVLTHQDTTHHRDFTNYSAIPRICEVGATAGLDEVSQKVNTTITNTNTGGVGSCNVFNTMNSGSINDAFPGVVPNTLNKDGTWRSRGTASYITGSHNAKIGWEGGYFTERVRNEVNDLRLSYHYATPDPTCVGQTATNPYACGNMTLYYPNDPFNLITMRTRPVGFEMNTGPAETDERVWFGAVYLQDQWTLNRFTISSAVRWDHAASRYGSSCVGPDRFVPLQADGKDYWCSTPQDGVSYHDITPRWGVAWDVFGDGKTSVKWNMGKYLQAAGFGGSYTDDNPARRSTNLLTRGWDDVNGNRIVECDFFNPAAQTNAGGDVCGTLLGANGVPSNTFLQFGRAPNSSQLFNSNSFCGRTGNSSVLHQQYCDAAGQNLMSGWGVRRAEWQFGLGIQREVLPRLSVEATFNHRKYLNLQSQDVLGRGCDYYLAGDVQGCLNNYANFNSTGGTYDFFSITAPVDPSLPNGGGYTIKGITNQKVPGALPSLGGVTTIRPELEYSWNGIDTNFSYRLGAFRVSGGTSTGASSRNTCATDVDTPNVKGREGNLYAGGCVVNNPWQTNVRANASYTVPKVDVVVGTIYQSRPGGAIAANWAVPFSAAVWEPSSATRATSAGFFGLGTTPTTTQVVNLLDTGDLYGERQSLVDVTLRKNLRFGGKRVSLGVDVYNVFNSDAATAYTQTYTATRLPNGTWVQDDPATPAVEVNHWGEITQLVSPRFMRLLVTFDF